MRKESFINNIANYVQKYAKQYGIEVHSPIIAQAILESGWGKSTLSSKYHNYFGMKCGTKWAGKSVNMTTQEEFEVGVHTTIKDNFRVYDNMEDGIKGYFEFIQLPRYSNLKGVTDPLKYLETIKADGYATSSTYVENNMKIIEQYDLTKYDEKEGNCMKRSNIVDQAKKWIGCKEANGTHKKIIDVYNAHRPLARGYKVKYTDHWCATFVSACAIKCGYTNIIPTECSCNYMIKLFKGLGAWMENDGYTPKPGDVIFYDWQDRGVGDCTGSSEHVGIVECVNNGVITVIEGNKYEAVARRNIKVNGRYIRGYGVPKYNDEAVAEKPNVSIGSKDIVTVAKEVIAGKWGNGLVRSDKLKKAGYDPSEVQKKVNELLRRKPIDVIAKEVINGEWGNGSVRTDKLKKAGYDPSEVQKKVNELLNRKSITAIAKEVIAGKWGNGKDRVKRLKQAGYNPSEVQKAVNNLL